MLRFDGKVAIVTGGGRGIGRAYALLLAERGAAVVVNDIGSNLDGHESDAGPANDVVAEITALGGRAAASIEDVHSGPEAIIATAIDTFGHLDIVVNNAGINGRLPFTKSDLDYFQLHMAIHFYGTLGLVQAAWPHLIESGKGRIVNTISGTVIGIANRTAYSAAKGAIWGFTNCLAVDGEPFGVKANCIGPAAGTRMSLAPDQDIPSVLANYGEQMPPELVAPVVAYLAHEDCELTGMTLSAGGGKVSRLAAGHTAGFTDTSLTPEMVRDRLAEVLDPNTFQVQERVVVA
ncbi:SDR family NAD(P)-dependent oxidoreductase [Frankia sp. CNm7]|uniref:SDR family NAD(P)-dependent oxidoreductase n=1 Tax=Frankia nepalensis TaxID=1836974 RepID=A0A937RBN0_9ACTN|nr:SDR family NAD(P)-dependent oxidoreductase [Frankia nepalensis]MBL7502690.1 SDR family NAD(P)-dependent oxidoreductase [Frankia nepalensis]MBL7515027.1 SDR family NAD(P)-dependent oxidoreductase [Frankia nepalensis]MBL7518724.1 SDR family NAD(P)-dependent oxidoreductase [Frankia nepalensis]MBL7629163.1 SDR family NAD(P)-dependent oxidoreductase [Frankia nepalensis]